MNVILLIIIGAGAGFLATRMMKIEAGIVPSVGIGIAGALVGGLVLQVLLRVMGALAGFVGAILGALVLIWIWQTYFQKR